MGAKSSADKELAPIPWRDPNIDGLAVIELSDDEAEVQWLAAFYSLHQSQAERDNAPTVPSPLGRS